MLTLITGGARSGKSNYAEQQGTEDVLFIATAQAFDEEMKIRINQHKESRPAEWHTVETPTNVANAIAEQIAEKPTINTIILDCITLMISNLLIAVDPLDKDIAHNTISNEIALLIALIAAHPEKHWIIVTNEVGLGIVPVNQLARLYRDELGYANQSLATAAQHVIMLVCGLPVIIK